MLPNQNTTAFLSDSLPAEIEGLMLIEPVSGISGEIHSSVLGRFDKMISLEIDGLTGRIYPNSGQIDAMVYVLDVPLKQLEHLSLNNVGLRRHKMDKPITNMYQNNIEETNEILPYDVYVMNQKDAGKSPVFAGHDNLITLQVSSCNLQQINWQMFDGLKNLLHLNLDNNKLKFIPDFAFYGTPKLKTLSLSRNNLLSVQVTDLAGLLELEYLDLSYNSFTQLSELSFPPFPKLKLADLRNNPISSIYPHTFDVMNTTEGLEIGCSNMSTNTLECNALEMLANSFRGLTRLKRLTVTEARTPMLTRDMFAGLGGLVRLTMNGGTIDTIEYDAFAEMTQLQRLSLTRCRLRIVSMDAFYGLEQLRVLDLSQNEIETLPPGVFDELHSLTELYLHKNKLQTLPNGLFGSLTKNVKLIRLNDNPWTCSCEMGEWDARIVNMIKNRNAKWGPCGYFSIDKGYDCSRQLDQSVLATYTYDNRVAPKCTAPSKYKNMGVFQVLRKHLQCKPVKASQPDFVVSLPEQNLNKIPKPDKPITKMDVKMEQLKLFNLPVQGELDLLYAKPAKPTSLDTSEKLYKKSTFKKYKQNYKILDKLRKMHEKHKYA